MFMAWLEQDCKKDTKKRLEEAITYFVTKYGLQPTICHVHKTLVNIVYPGIQIVPVKHVYTPNLFYIGVPDEQ